MHIRHGFATILGILAAGFAALTGALLMTGAGAGADHGDENATFVAIRPCRLFDLRTADYGERTSPLGPGEVLTQQVTGSIGDCTIPAEATGLR